MGKAGSAEEARQKAEEARAISSTVLNVAQNNYAEAQGIVDMLVSKAEWMRGRRVVLMASSILNAGELNGAVAALIDASRPIGHRRGFWSLRSMLKKCLGKSLTLVIAQ
ncbi:hypothetical protein HanIR_Chr09g0392801 [Helianthus annuus]|nr:hypothetical protein HanIR_Chr09g0392801 [Helianthus annuus]